jgi:S1-C subfamily serine protease
MLRKMPLTLAVIAIMFIFSGIRGDETEDEKLVKELEDSLVKLVEKVSPAFVNFQAGSGVCISPDGYVLTNHHVAGRSMNWTVGMPGGPTGKRYKAKMVWLDPFGDICLLKIDNKGKEMPYVPLGDSDSAKVGQFAIALGTPFMTAREDSQPTVTFGIISAVHRNMGNYSDCIQTDARVNPGNSGGPLIGMDGKLLGINGQIRVRFPYRVNTGIGLAVPTHQIKRFIEKYKNVPDGTTVYHGTINGLQLANNPKAVATVEKVEGGSTADKAGFKVGDIILSVDKYDIPSAPRFWGAILAYPEGWQVKVKVQRGTQTVELDVTLDKYAPRGMVPAQQPAPRTDAYMGVLFNPEPVNGGCQVQQVVEGSPAEKAGLQPGDIIIEADEKKIDGPQAMLDFLATKKPGDKIKLKLLREGKDQMELELELGKRPQQPQR